jgi:coenzyme F420-reducing hydrogenase alpha subunit
MSHGSRAFRVSALSRVEGEGGLELVVSGGQVTEARLDIYEPPRFFEGMLRGRKYTEPPDITARICGICPVAYQMSACHAIEQACGVTVPAPVAALRRLLYCGEWIESHALHVYLLHAPDYLGYPGGIEMARDHPGTVNRGLRIKKAGNHLMTVVGGRSVHPVNVRVGGFYRAPAQAALQALIPELEQARADAQETVRWVSGFPVPDFERSYELVALRQADGQYPITAASTAGTRIVSTGGLDIAPAEYDEHFAEHQVPHSTALHSTLDGRTYLTGPLARYSLASALLPADVAAAARAAGLGGTCANPFRSIVVRAVELLYACDEALRLIRSYEPPDPPAAGVTPRDAVGYGCTEAPRGLLYHRYAMWADGTITDAKIVPPTSQNQRAIEADLRELASIQLDLHSGELTAACERAVRCYDPCISCATHFLDLRMSEGR